MATEIKVSEILEELSELYPHQIKLPKGSRVASIWTRQLQDFDDRLLQEAYENYLNDLTEGFPTVGGLAAACRALQALRLPDYQAAFSEILHKAPIALKPLPYDRAELKRRAADLHEAVQSGLADPVKSEALLQALRGQYALCSWSHNLVSYAMEQAGGAENFVSLSEGRDKGYALNTFKATYEAALQRWPQIAAEYVPVPLSHSSEKMTAMRQLAAATQSADPQALQLAVGHIAAARQGLPASAQPLLPPAPVNPESVKAAQAFTYEQRIARIDQALAEGKISEEDAYIAKSAQAKLEENKRAEVNVTPLRPLGASVGKVVDMQERRLRNA